jgi:predicted murein hydrolase (TIGR00659 family)
MTPDPVNIWVYLSASPLLGLTITLVAYNLAYRLYTRAHTNPLLNPVATAIGALIVFLLLTDINYYDYFRGAQFVHFLLGPATVALAVPLYHQLTKLKRLWLPLALSIFSGVTIAALCSIGIVAFLGASPETIFSLAPKSATAPVAMGISERIGGLPSLTAVLVVSTGIIGAVTGTKLLTILRIKDDSVKGVAKGLTAHGIGTARAFQINREMGTFSGLAMALSAFATAVILPWLVTHIAPYL